MFLIRRSEGFQERERRYKTEDVAVEAMLEVQCPGILLNLFV